jgi:TorA maturation chaperone TorD/ferredoxin
VPSASLSLIYGFLAEALADTTGVAAPEWLARAGQEWPLYEPAMRLSEISPIPSLTNAVRNLAILPEGSFDSRLSVWKRLLTGNGRLPLAVYESMYRNGRLLGPATFAVKAEYQKAGLDVDGPELPDHIAVELEFLSYLANQESKKGEAAKRWSKTRQMFIKNHAAQWMPSVGQQLASMHDPAWLVIGQLLGSAITLPECSPSRRHGSGYPVLNDASRCSLCGFCVQVCPVRALCIKENEEATSLLLFSDLCIQCRKCEQICGEKALVMGKAELSIEPFILRHSPRAICPGCRQSTISEAELSAVARRLGEHPKWLDYCTVCRGRGFQDIIQGPIL